MEGICETNETYFSMYERERKVHRFQVRVPNSDIFSKHILHFRTGPCEPCIVRADYATGGIMVSKSLFPQIRADQHPVAAVSFLQPYKQDNSGVIIKSD